MPWPDSATPGWQDTEATLHLWTQIVGKTRLALAPMLNHWWQVPLYVTARGLTTSVIETGDRAFEVELDFIAHELRVRDASGRTPSFPLESFSVAEFYGRYRETLRSIEVELKIFARPVEIPEAIPFADDEQHHTYDREWVSRLFTVLVESDRLMKEFRAGFLGKASPVHFFWGGFDMAVTRFSGRRAPKHPGGIPNCADWVMHEAYSHEVSSCGFWPGNAWYPEAAFYAYAYPQPDGFAAAAISPAAAHFDSKLGEFILPYDAVRRCSDPDADVLAFFESTYRAAADLATWDCAALERVTRTG